MNLFSRNILPIITVCAVVLVMGCGDPVPVKEMAEAHSGISDAVAVKAEKYAPAQLKEANTLLIASHDLVKAEKYDDAQKKASDSIAKAKEAYDIALPLYTKEALDSADKAVAEADAVYASELANADFENAQSKLKAAHSDYDSKKYADAYKEAVEAEKSALNAKQLSLAKKDSLKDAIAEVSETVKRAEQFGASKNSPEKLKIAKDKIAEAQTSYDGLKLKEGFIAVGVAKASADEAYFEALKVTAAANIVKADKAISDVEKNPNAAAVADEINGAKEMQKTSRSQYDGGLYKESIQSSDEALRLAGIALSVATKTPIEKNGKNVAAGTDADKGSKDASAAADKGVGAGVEEGNGEYDIYVVQYFKDKAKDCLWFIAGKFYKNPRKWPVIYKANGDQIKNPNLIRPGWKLRIPKQGSAQ